MKLLQSEVREDVLKVFNSKAPSSASYLLDVRLWTKAGLEIIITRTHEMILERDYINGMGDNITLVCEVSRATYEHLLFPNRSDLKISLTKTPTDKNGDNPKEPETSDYRAILLNPNDNTFTTATMGGDKIQDKEMDNYPIALQLIDLELEEALEIELSTVLTNVSLKEYIETLVSNFGTFGIIVHPLDNTENPDFLVLEQGQPMLEFANWLQAKSVGLYNHGCNTYYISNTSVAARPAGSIPGVSVYSAIGWMYVYPPMLVDKHPDRKRHVIFRCAPDELVGVETSYRIENEVAYIVTTGDVDYSNTTEERERNMGNVIAFDKKPNYLDDRVVHNNGVTEFNNDGWVHIANANRRVNRVATYQRQTCKVHREESRLSEALGTIIEITWENPNAIIFPPNTEVELYYVNVDKLYKYEGVVVGYTQRDNAIPVKGNRSVFRPIAKLRIRVQEITMSGP